MDMEAPGSMSPALAGLNERHRAFVLAYVGSARGNITQAAIIAGYSEKSAASQVSRLLRNSKIRSAIDVLVRRSTC